MTPLRSAVTNLVLALALGAPAAAPAVTLEQALDHHYAGRIDEAVAIYRALVATPGTPAADLASAHNNLCVVHNDRGEYAAALAECREAERGRRALGDRLRLAHTLNNLALAHQYLGDAAAAEGAFREALALDRELGETEDEAIVLANLAALAIGGGRYGAALDALAGVEALTAAHAGDPWAPEQRRVAMLNRAVVLERLGAHREALGGLLELAREPEPDSRHEAALAANLGVIYRNLGDPRAAARELDRAAALFRAERDRGGLANALLNRGQVAELHLREPESAERLYLEALAEAEAGGDRGQQVQALIFLGRLRRGAGRDAAAESDLGAALDLARGIDDPEAAAAALGELARLDRARGDGDGAARRLDEALAALESVRAGARSSGHAAGYVADKRALYAAAVDLAAERALASGARADVLAALARVERAKARELLDALGGGTLEPLDAAALDRLDRTPGTRIELYLGERRLWRFRLGDGGAALADAGDAATALERAQRVHAALGRGAAPARADLDALGRDLLGGLGELSGPLVIAPDGRLRYLPFELLAPREGAPLVERAEIVYLPSLSVVPVRSGGARAWSFVGFGAVAPPALGARGGLTAGRLLADRFALAPLPASARELAAAAARLPPPFRIELEAAATEAELRRRATEGSRVLHFATHAVVDERLEPGAAIFLAPAGEDDGLLTAAEIARLPLAADLAVLAACRSAVGSAADGRALSSLTGAFLAAGAGGVVASLWEVGDAATAAFMEQFYFGLGRGHTPAVALARAKRRLRADPRWSDPALWAAFVLVGDAPAVAPSWRRFLPAFAAGAAAAALALAAALYRAGSRRRSASSDAASSRPDASSAETRTR